MSTEPTPSVSSIVANTAIGSHLMKIDGYSSTLQRFVTGDHTSSDHFSVGGHTWYLAYLPNGDCLEHADYISFFLVLHSNPAVPVMADFTLSVLDPAGKASSYTKQSRIYCFDGTAAHWGFSRFIERSVLEKSRWLKDDMFAVKCDVVVTVGFTVEADTAAAPAFVKVPPPDCLAHLLNLLESGEGADVKFVIGREEFKAHRCVLAARSPVFQAQFYGPMQEGVAAQQCVVEVKDTNPDVFRNLLRFIYTESLASTDVESIMYQHLLVAADRYNMARLKIVCEELMCRSIDVSNVATTLALAEQHRFSSLKVKCIEFLKRPGVMKTILLDDFEHLTKTCPSLMKELFTQLAGS